MAEASRLSSSPPPPASRAVTSSLSFRGRSRAQAGRCRATRGRIHGTPGTDRRYRGAQGQHLSVMTIVARCRPARRPLIIVGLGGEKSAPSWDFAQLGGSAAGKLNSKMATVLLDLQGVPVGIGG